MTTTNPNSSYRQFISGKKKYRDPAGFKLDPDKLNSHLFPFQRTIVRWALECGTAALFEECGLGKTLQLLAWAEQIVKKTNKPVLVLCPIAVAPQTLREAEKFKIDCPVQITNSEFSVTKGINLSNYEKLHLLDPKAFAGVVLDESSILKSYVGKTKQKLVEAFKNTPYKLACTATPAPNDRMELGNHSEFLSVLPSSEMLERWFINDTMKAGGYRLRRHAQADFWDWASTWAVCISKPSDLGFDDAGYALPPLQLHEHVIESDNAGDGFLFYTGHDAISATNVHREKRRVLGQRVEKVAALVNNSAEAWAVWCDTDYEADELRKAIPDAVEVRGSHNERMREERLTAFSAGQARVIITKPEIGGFGLNWQHCHNTTWFAGYSFEKFYQSIRRLWRFGQQHPVNCHIVMSEAEQSIAAAVKRKQDEHQEMFCEMAEQMKEGMLERVRGILKVAPYHAPQATSLPAWLNKEKEFTHAGY